MSETGSDEERRERMKETVRLIVMLRERAPRSPRMERALKRLIWRYTQELQAEEPAEPTPGEAESSPRGEPLP